MKDIAERMKLGDELDGFIETIADSFVKLELVRFFYRHPGEWFAVKDLAEKLRRPALALATELRSLHSQGFLSVNGLETFSFPDEQAEPGANQNFKEKLALLEDLYEKREGRLKIIYKLLKIGKNIVEHG